MSDHKRYTDNGKYAVDPLEYHAGGNYMKQQIKKIRETSSFDSIPSVEDVMLLWKEVVVFETGYSSKRKATSRAKALAFSAFYGYQIPSRRKAELNDIDHIVPFSTKKRDTIDVCRLGNLQLIPSSINQKRGVKPITDEWIRENDLSYQHYPSSEEYNQICGKGGVLSDVFFGEMCERREELYRKQIQRLFL
jgi:hypothetical protein